MLNFIWMSQEILFKEYQGFNRKWVLPVLALSCLAAITLLGLQVFGKVEVWKPLVAVFLVSLLLLLILNIRLETLIKTDGIYIRFSPFFLKTKYYSWQKIDSCFVRTYNPIGEYGGWGIRCGFKSGWAYSPSGNRGIQIIFEDGSKLLIGTQKGDEAATTLQKLGFRQPLDKA